MFVGSRSGPALISALETELNRTTAAIAAQLAPYDPVVTPTGWHRVLQGAEELISFATEPLDDEALHDAFVDMPLGQAVGPKRVWLEQRIRAIYDGGIETRMLDTLTVVFGLVTGCQSHGYPLAVPTVAHAVGYLHTRRRRMVALLYVMPQLCKGTIKARTTVDLLPLMTLTELATGPVINISQMRMLAHLFDDYVVESNGVGCRGSRDVDLLDRGGMDPERVSIMDMLNHGVISDMPDSGHLDPRRLLSKAEVAHQIAMIEAAYAEFDLAETSFRPLCQLILPLLRGDEAHVVTVPAEPFLAAVDLISKQWPDISRAAFVHEGADYGVALNSHQPFIRIGDDLVGNVTLLTRFVYAWRDRVLNRKKRFQIRSGFIFEKKVRAILEPAGFVVAEVKRIKRREFDVVTTKAGVIHNFQCKNTLLDGRLVEGEPARYARHNAKIARAHRSAIAKERSREQLLKDQLGLSEVRHHVVTRFPILCDDADIIPFAALETWAAKAGA